MPELPEVQTIINGLEDRILSKEIAEIIELRPGTVQWFCLEKKLGNINLLSRRGKYIIIQTSNYYKLVIHLRMTGKLIFEKDPFVRSAHARAEIVFNDNSKVIFDDVRTFGKIQIMKKDEAIKAIEKLGVEPLSTKFTPEYLKLKLGNKKQPIKNSLLDQSIIAGLGNIYASEILFRSKIDPRKPGKLLKKKDLKNIVEHTKAVLSEAIKYNGTTISDYRSVEDKTGEFQNFLKVYGKNNCICGAAISKIKLAGRSTFFL